MSLICIRLDQTKQTVSGCLARFGQNPPFDTDTKIADDRITDKGDTLVDASGDKGNAAQIALGISQAFRARPPRAHARFFVRLIAELVCF
ncbi:MULTISPECIES: hypothetical protein [Burkholderia cepacia complex]|uniref:Uncharacterized protein n=2 Tax=Burkholderia cepacia complex TaxID=87882 RepID=A0ABN5CVA4_BURCE|nr:MULTISPECIES: hypothetical protein [Burkholderia cepacia complex]ALK16362.1 hypothetical protein APZ15_00275 [Burkholderia cepacia ATCC 25416]AQT50857.1 hypothetical protein BHQ31_12880 [Burkholderia cenocepacia]ASE95019.1 hypothetical protein CEQ23_16320 [Burkholderia cepacia]ATF76802.1 hypothetical protein CO711_04665 [Burkholderia cepacia]MBJ9729139.1 hypothetical protein [Burkholderia cenocepacia]